jgi:hypothetical protein
MSWSTRAIIWLIAVGLCLPVGSGLAGVSSRAQAAQVGNLPPLPPVPPLPPLPPLPAPPVFSGFGERTRVNSQRKLADGTWLHFKVRGRVALTDDERDVESLSPNGYFEIANTSGRWFSRSGWRYRVRANGNGTLSRRFDVDGDTRPLDAEGRRWVAEAIERQLIESGFNAATRVARILAAEGPEGVLQVASTLSSDFVKSVYLVQLLRQTAPDAAAPDAAEDAAAEQVALLPAYLEVLRSMDSDFEKARVLLALISRGEPTPALQRAVAEVTLQIDSDFEKSRVLGHLVEGAGLDASAAAAFFVAVNRFDSDFERRRVLSRLASRRGLSSAIVLGIVRATVSMDSDFDKAQVLLHVIANQTIAPDARPALLGAAQGIDSDHHRGLVLSAMFDSGTLR